MAQPASGEVAGSAPVQFTDRVGRSRVKLTIISWNAEGIPKKLRIAGTDWSLGEPDVLCLQEVRIRASDATAITAMESAIPRYRAHYSLNRDTCNVTFRGGSAYGVVTYWKAALGRSHTEVPEWDREGRIVVSRFETFTLMNVYGVNGTSKPYFDHALGDSKAIDTRSNGASSGWCSSSRVSCRVR